MKHCITAKIKNGKLIMSTSKSKKCKKKVEDAQSIINGIKSRKIIIK